MFHFNQFKNHADRKGLPRNLKVESLENRQLMACDLIEFIEVDAGLLKITTTDDADRVIISQEYGSDQVDVYTWVTQDGDTEQCGVRSFDQAQIERMEVRLGDGNDYLKNATTIPDLVYGGAGNDELRVGHGPSHVFGGFGNDLIRGYGGDDFLYGEDGVDQIWGNQGNDSINGGRGADSRLVGGYGDDTLDPGFDAFAPATDVVWGDLEGGVAGFLPDEVMGSDTFILHSFYELESSPPRDLNAGGVADSIEYVDHAFEWSPADGPGSDPIPMPGEPIPFPMP